MFIVKQKIHGKDYYYLRKSVREGDKVISKCVAYLGKDKTEAEKKAKEIEEKLKRGESIDNIKNKEKGDKLMDESVKIAYFVHGTTIDNEEGKSTGQNHGELSELGIKQSKELSKQNKEKFDVVFCSDLKRAVDSAKISFADKYKIIEDNRLRECNYGDLNGKEEGKINYLEHIDKKFPNGESLIDVENRIKNFLDFLIKNYKGKHVAIVAHKAPQLAIEVLLNNKTWKQAIESDWRKVGKWQPGWDYKIKNIEDKAGSINIEDKAGSILTIEEMMNFCKRKGFVYASGEIYGGLGGFWDFGHLGVELKNNIKKSWWEFHVHGREDMTGIDGSIITNPKVWEASGHVGSFVDVAVVCKKCKYKTKIDKHELGKAKCDKCGNEYENKGEFNPMFTTQVGPIKDDSIKAYLRPETAQLIFADFKLVQENARMQLPFGIAQVGKSFRNEISPREFLFRCREFEQMEIEYFIEKNMKCPHMEETKEIDILVYDERMQKQGKEPELMDIYTAWKKGIIKTDWHAYWIAKEFEWFISLGVNPSNFRIRQHCSDEKSHYATDTWDLEYKFPMGWRELQGFANRSDYDLKQHQQYSKQSMEIDYEGKKVLPHVVCEPSLGVERSFLVFMFDGYCYSKERNNIILKLNPKLAPIKAAVFPIVKQPEYIEIAENIVKDLRKEFNVIYDRSGSIGRRYARNDETGTIACITVDEQSLKDKTITIRDRDTTEQVRVKISELKEVMRKVINEGCSILEFGKKVSTRVK